MRSERFVDRWVGLGLVLVGAVASLCLAATGKLTLYVHPRYLIFTVVLSVIAVVTVVVAIARLGRDEEQDHDRHDHGSERGPSPTRRLFSWSKVAILVFAALALLVVPPATLTATTRQSRDLVTSGQSLDAEDATVLLGANSALFSVKDWATLLRQGGAEAVVGKDFDASGYVLDDGRDDAFYLGRLSVRCCAVDAQPIGIPVYRPGWRQEVKPSDWVSVKGAFVENQDARGDDPAIVQVVSLSKIDEPDQPYVF